MKKYIFLFTLIIVYTFISCAPPPEKIIAIDVLLMPSEEMNAQAIQLNTLMKQNNPETIKLDEKHVPHITLLQCFVNEKNLPKINKALNGLFETIAHDSLKAESLFYYEEKEESFAMIRIEKSAQLMKIHKKAIELVKTYIVKNGSEVSFVQNPDDSPISESTVSYVPEFVDKHSFQNFDPHISLGVAQKILLDSLAKHVFKPIHFKATSVSVYQLGDHGTAQKLLWKSQ